MAVSNESLALALLVDASADSARDAGLSILDSRAAELRRQKMAAEAEQRRHAEAAAAATAARRAQLVYLVSGALTGAVVGIVINMILSTRQSNGRSLGDVLGISAGWTMIIVLVTVGLGLAFAAHDHREDLDFVETVRLAGSVGGPLAGICVVLGVLVSEIRDDDNVVEKVLVVILNGGLGGIAGVIAGAISFGVAGILYATVRRIAMALTGTS